GREQANSLYMQYRDLFQNRNNLQSNFVSPLMGQGQLKSLGGNNTFNVSAINCGSSSYFLEIVMQPLPSGDVNFIIVYDQNNDGKMDTTLRIEGVSGVCTNGIVRCHPGTWSGCQYFVIDYRDRKIVFDITARPSELGGCVCFNNFCGDQIAIKRKDKILSLFGTAIGNAIQRRDPKFMISSAGIEDLIIRYYGQNVDNCRAPLTGAEQAQSIPNSFQSSETLNMSWQYSSIIKEDSNVINTSRLESITSSLQYSSGVAIYDDVRLEKNVYKKYSEQKIYLNLGEEGEYCPKMCKVRVKDDVLEVGRSGPINQLNVSFGDGKWREEFRECRDDVCVIDAENEEIIENCNCVNSFEEAIIALQLIRQIGQDLVCTTGEEQKKLSSANSKLGDNFLSGMLKGGILGVLK
ncbi:MAG: hypothetical protein QW607_11400, partial [Desulfurococcaceae archaeon]